MGSSSKSRRYKDTTFQQLRSFYETARLGSLSAAADQLDLSHPTVWAQVHALERDLGEALIAIIVAKPSAALNESEMMTALQARLAKFKLPKRVFLAGELPRNAMGKVQKAELSKKYREIFKG